MTGGDTDHYTNEDLLLEMLNLNFRLMGLSGVTLTWYKKQITF